MAAGHVWVGEHNRLLLLILTQKLGLTSQMQAFNRCILAEYRRLGLDPDEELHRVLEDSAGEENSCCPARRM